MHRLWMIKFNVYMYVHGYIACVDNIEILSLRRKLWQSRDAIEGWTQAQPIPPWKRSPECLGLLGPIVKAHGSEQTCMLLPVSSRVKRHVSRHWPEMRKPMMALHLAHALSSSTPSPWPWLSSSQRQTRHRSLFISLQILNHCLPLKGQAFSLSALFAALNQTHGVRPHNRMILFLQHRRSPRRITEEWSCRRLWPPRSSVTAAASGRRRLRSLTSTKRTSGGEFGVGSAADFGSADLKSDSWTSSFFYLTAQPLIYSWIRSNFIFFFPQI